MIAHASAEQCLSFIHSQLQAPGQPGESAKKNVRRAVAISRQTGSGAGMVAKRLADYLQQHPSGDGRPWMVFDRNLMDQVLEDHNLPTRLAKYLPEDRSSQLEDILADVFEVHPPSQTVIYQSTETILRLADLGNVILIGRGSNVITARLPHVLHVRLVAPLEKRIEHVHEFYNLTGNEAQKFCLSQDRARERYLKCYFNAEMNDPLLYHLVINTGLIGYDQAAKLIGNAVLNLPQG
jgi:cytidylate kinase